MKLMFASDLHGSGYFTEKLMQRYAAEKPDKLVLLGDLLYHGPRNDLTQSYDPRRVTTLLNGIKENIIAVRGNCDAEVDQMVLEFPITADYVALPVDGRTLFCTHGHLYDADKLPALRQGDVFLQGHTHARELANCGTHYFCNPGSVSLPKGDGKNAYLVYENGVFTSKDMDGNPIESMVLA